MGVIPDIAGKGGDSKPNIIMTWAGQMMMGRRKATNAVMKGIDIVLKWGPVKR